MNRRSLLPMTLSFLACCLIASLMFPSADQSRGVEATESAYRVDSAQVDWQVFVSAVTECSSPLYSMAGAAGEATVGQSSSPNYGVSQGFIEVTTCCELPGDANDDGNVDIADLTFYVDYMFASGADPACRDQADVDGSGTLDITDLTYRVDFMFAGGADPVCGQTGLK